MNDIWILAIVGGIALIFLLFAGGLFHVSAQSGSASGQAGSGGSGLLTSGGAGGVTANPSTATNPVVSGAPISSSSTFGAVTGSSIQLGNVSGQGGVTIYEPYIYAPTSSEQTYTSSSYAPVNVPVNVQVKTPIQNAPNTGLGGGVSGGGGFWSIFIPWWAK